MDDDFSKLCKTAVSLASDEALRARSFELTPEHLFLGIVKAGDRIGNIFTTPSIVVRK